MLQDKEYPNIDVAKTGERLKRAVTDRGCSVGEIQQFLHFARPQPIYRWLRGEVLPKIDHLYALSRVFGLDLEELIVGDYPGHLADFCTIIRRERGRTFLFDVDRGAVLRRVRGRQRLRAYQGL